jgi:hypothetical protein
MNFDSKLALQQLCRSEAPVRVLKTLVGSTHVYAGPRKAEFTFKMCRKADVCRIEYTVDDTYKMTFLKIVGHQLVEVEVFDGIYYDDLKKVFESFTGLYLSLR